MHPAISNIALPAFDHSADLIKLVAMGYQGIEVAPSRIWQNTWDGLQNEQVNRYRTEIEQAGLKVVGLHSLVFDHPELQLFGDTASTEATLQFMAHLSSVCRDLGGRTLIWGGGRRRGTISADEAFDRAVEFMRTLCDKTSDHGTVFCFEPLGPSDSDFVNSVLEAKAIADAVNCHNLCIQIDAKALVENNEIDTDVFNAAASTLVHVHANEPGLGVIGSSGEVDHGRIGSMLYSLNYDRFVTVEQRMLSETHYLDDARESLRVLKTAYGIK